MRTTPLTVRTKDDDAQQIAAVAIRDAADKLACETDRLGRDLAALGGDRARYDSAGRAIGLLHDLAFQLSTGDRL